MTAVVVVVVVVVFWFFVCLCVQSLDDSESERVKNSSMIDLNIHCVL